MDNLENENVNEQSVSNNIENGITSNAKKISWLNIASDFFTALIGANMLSSSIILANTYNIENLPTVSKISVYVGGISSILIGSGITLKSSQRGWKRLETKLYGDNLEENESEKGNTYIKKR